MPPAKRVKSSGTARPPPSLERHATDEGEGESGFATLARQYWLKTAKRTAIIKVKNEVLKSEIWDALEKDDFPVKSLQALESLQTLESYLWPGYTDDSSNYHVLLIVLIVNVKRKERLEAWGVYSDHVCNCYGN